MLIETDNPILQAKQRKTSVTAPVAPIEKTIRPLSQNRKNPFAKRTSMDESTTSSPRGLAVFDQPKVTQTKPATGPSKENANKAKVSKQQTLFGMKKSTKEATSITQEVSQDSQDNAPSPAQPPKSGFMLWLDQNRAQLKEEQPDANDAEIVRLGAQKFKTLSEEERQVL